MSITHDVIKQKQLDAKPPKHMATTLKDSRAAELSTDIDTVVDILKKNGHCPVTKLIEASKNDRLEPHQQAAVNKWLMEHAYAKPKSVEISGKNGGAINVIFGEAEADF